MVKEAKNVSFNARGVFCLHFYVKLMALLILFRVVALSFTSLQLIGHWPLAFSVLTAAALHVDVLVWHCVATRAFQNHVLLSGACFSAAGAAVVHRIGLSRVSVNMQNGNVTQCQKPTYSRGWNQVQNSSWEKPVVANRSAKLIWQSSDYKMPNPIRAVLTQRGSSSSFCEMFPSHCKVFSAILCSSAS